MKSNALFFLGVIFLSVNAPANAEVTVPKTMNYNVYMLENTINPGRKQLQRAQNLVNSNLFDSMEVVVFNEIFDNASSNVLLDGLKEEFPYQTPVLGREKSGWDDTQGWMGYKPEDGGVALVSRYPIKSQTQVIYQQACGADWLSQKGFIHAVIEKSNQRFHFIATHVQAEDNACKGGDVAIRKSQFETIRDYINQKDIPNDEMIIILGDLNVMKASPEYRSMLETHNVNEPDSYAGADYSWDPSSNALVHANYPDLKGQLLDYIFVEKDHKQPRYWHNQVWDVVSPRLEIFGTFESYYMYEYSDHYPVVAFEFADETTPTRSFRADNQPYDRIQLQHAASNKFVSAAVDDREGWLEVDSEGGSEQSFFKMDSWTLNSAFCVYDGDYVRVSRTDEFSNFYWNWRKDRYYTDHKNASHFLKIRREKPADTCIQNGDEVVLFDHALFGKDEYLAPNKGELVSHPGPASDSDVFYLKMPELQYTDWSRFLRYN